MVTRAFTIGMVAGLVLGACALFSGGQTAEEPSFPEGGKRARAKPGLSMAIVEKQGAVVLQRPYAEVYEAAKDALSAMGYRIAVSKPKRGLLISGRLRVGGETSSLGIVLPSGLVGSTTQSVSYSRQYTLYLKKLGPRRTWVAAVPAVFAGAHDISANVKWNVWGRFGERTRWKQLFHKIRELLPEQTSPKTPPRPRERVIPPPSD